MNLEPKNPELRSPPQGGSETDQNTPRFDSIDQFQHWLNLDLIELQEECADWATPNTNRKHFGR